MTHSKRGCTPKVLFTGERQNVGFLFPLSSSTNWSESSQNSTSLDVVFLYESKLFPQIHENIYHLSSSLVCSRDISCSPERMQMLAVKFWVTDHLLQQTPCLWQNSKAFTQPSKLRHCFLHYSFINVSRWHVWKQHLEKWSNGELAEKNPPLIHFQNVAFSVTVVVCMETHWIRRGFVLWYECICY